MQGKPGCGCGGNSKNVSQEMPSDVREFLAGAVRNRPRTLDETAPSAPVAATTIDGAARAAVVAQDGAGGTGSRPVLAQGIEQAARQSVQDVSGQQR